MIFKKIKIEKLFSIEKSKGLNENKLNTSSPSYPYITRTRFNNGVNCYTGYIEGIEPNPENTISLGLLDMTFFYQSKKWYSGQYVRLISPKFKMNKYIGLYFVACFSKYKHVWKSVLVRDFDNMFINTEITLPVNEITGKIDFEYMEEYIEKIQQIFLKKIDDYLIGIGYNDLNDCTLTSDDLNILDKDMNFKEFRLKELFDISGTKSIDEKNVTYVKPSSGVDYVTRTQFIPGQISPLSYPPNEGNTITATVIGNYKYVKYHKNEYYCCQNINKLRPKFVMNENVGLYFVTLINNFVKQYNDQQGGYKLSEINDYIVKLPYNNETNEICFDYIDRYINVIKKMVLNKLRHYIEEKTNTLN